MKRINLNRCPFAFVAIIIFAAGIPSLAQANLSIHKETDKVAATDQPPVTLPIKAEDLTADLTHKPPAKAVPNWVIDLPATTSQLCFSGVCLGDSVDQLSRISANAYGVKTPGLWRPSFGRGRLGINAESTGIAEESAAVMASMRDLRHTCEMPGENEVLKPLMRLAFIPDDGSPGGMEVLTQILPKRSPSESSTYAITHIKMTMQSIPSELALEWVGLVAQMWPGLSPLISEDGKTLPDYYSLWSASSPIPKGFSDAPRTEVTYSVDPVLAVDDDEFNANQWIDKVITHELDWSHGLSRSLRAGLASQKECL